MFGSNPELVASSPVLLLREGRGNFLFYNNVYVDKTHCFPSRPPLEREKRKKEKKEKKEKKKKEKTHRVLPRPPPEGGKRRDASVALVLDLEVEFKMQNLILIRIFRNSSHQYRFRYTNI